MGCLSEGVFVYRKKSAVHSVSCERRTESFLGQPAAASMNPEYNRGAPWKARSSAMIPTVPVSMNPWVFHLMRQGCDCRMFEFRRFRMRFEMVFGNDFLIISQIISGRSFSVAFAVIYRNGPTEVPHEVRFEIVFRHSTTVSPPCF